MSHYTHRPLNEPRLPHAGSETRRTLVVSSEPALASEARLACLQSFIEPTRLFTSNDLLHEALFEL
jgi:hypothetical protein